MSFKYMIPLALLSGFAVAEENKEKLWSGEVDVGFTNLTGNSDETNLSGKIEIIRENQPYKWVNHAEMLYTESQDSRTAEKYFLSTYLSYNFKPKAYTFGRATYETDKFSGFDYQTNYILGLGWNIYSQEAFKWDAELGAGYRSSVVEAGLMAEDSDEAIGTISTQVDWQFSEESTFKQYLSYEIGEEINILYSTTELSINMLENLFFKLSYHIKHTSDVPIDTDKLDTETIASFSYSF